MEEKTNPMEKYKGFDSETGEEISLPEMFQQFVNYNNLKITGSVTVKALMDKLEKAPNSLTLQELQKLGKKLNTPVNTHTEFYMTGLSEAFSDYVMEKMSKNCSLFLWKILQNLEDGVFTNKIKGKDIESVEHLATILKVSRTTIYDVRRELEEFNIARFVMTDTKGLLIIPNPSFFKKSFISPITFKTFEEEIKNNNYLEYLYFKKKHEVSLANVIKRRPSVKR